MSKVKVKRNGQITMPLGLRERFEIQEGSVLEVEAREQGILLKHAVPLEAGPVVGEEAYKRILRDLESLRKKWR